MSNLFRSEVERMKQLHREALVKHAEQQALKVRAELEGWAAARETKGDQLRAAALRALADRVMVATPSDWHDHDPRPFLLPGPPLCGELPFDTVKRVGLVCDWLNVGNWEGQRSGTFVRLLKVERSYVSGTGPGTDAYIGEIRTLERVIAGE